MLYEVIRPKWHISLYSKIFSNILLFKKYLAIYHFLKFKFVKFEFVILLEFFEKTTFRFAMLFFIELELHQKFSIELEFVKLGLHG